MYEVSEGNQIYVLEESKKARACDRPANDQEIGVDAGMTRRSL